MRILTIFLFSVLLHFEGVARQLSPESQISLLTISPGEELYSTFGHTAIRISDPAQNMDVVFNYGTFDFNTPNFYLKFARGKLNYILSVESFERFYYGYQVENRSVFEQVLNLNLLQKQILFDLLLENYKPENRNYKYDFFFDNCATRIRDIMVTAFGDSLNFNFSSDWEDSGLTFRNLIDLYLTKHHWSDFGIDLGLGLPTDRVARPEEYMFLPDFLMRAFSFATIQRDGKSIPFVSISRKLIGKKEVIAESTFFSPNDATWTLFAIAFLISVLGFWLKRRLLFFDYIFFSVIGLLGWFIFVLWFLTDHVATKDNLNILWALPIHFPLILVMIKKGTSLAKYYRLGSIFILIAIIAIWWDFPQQFHIAIIPLFLIMIIRLSYNHFFEQIKQYKLSSIIKEIAYVERKK